MAYFQGFVVPVKTADKAAYLEMAATMAAVFAGQGAGQTVECWGDDVMDGKVTDFRKAVQATAEETVVLSWVWWPDRARCDAAQELMMADARLQPAGPLPFDGKRLIHAGFDLAFDTGAAGVPGYVDGLVASVPDADRAEFARHSATMGTLFLEAGALRVVDGWGADVPPGKVTDFQRAVHAPAGETVVFGWVEWPDKPTRDAGMATLMNDARMRTSTPPWNGPLAIFGGFTPIFTHP